MPKITEITVNAGRTFNHPYESYSNLRPSITFTASLEDGEDYEAVAKQLQAKAEQMVEDHKNALLRNLEEIESLSRAHREYASLEAGIQKMQRQVEELRRQNPALALPGISSGSDTSDSSDDDEPQWTGSDREPRW